MSQQTITQTVCDKCRRPPDGDSPDCVYAYTCGHDVCNECARDWPLCVICGKGVLNTATVYGAKCSVKTIDGKVVDHEFVDPSNERVRANGYTMCLRCGLLKPPESPALQPMLDEVESTIRSVFNNLPKRQTELMSVDHVNLDGSRSPPHIKSWYVCRFCASEAVAIFDIPEGCACYPDDRVQTLCMQHVVGATPIGAMTLKEDLTKDKEFTKWWEARNGGIEVQKG